MNDRFFYLLTGSLLEGEDWEKFSQAGAVSDAWQIFKGIEKVSREYPLSADFRDRTHCDVDEAKTLFECILGRPGGGERAGRTVSSIIDDLVNSLEFSMRLVQSAAQMLPDEELKRRLNVIASAGRLEELFAAVADESAAKELATRINAAGCDNINALICLGEAELQRKRLVVAKAIFLSLHQKLGNFEYDYRRRVIFGCHSCFKGDTSGIPALSQAQQMLLNAMIPSEAFKHSEGNYYKKLASLSSEAINTVVQDPSEAYAVWDLAAREGERLPLWFAPMVYGAEPGMRIQFNRKSSHNWPADQTAYVTFSNDINIELMHGLPRVFCDRLKCIVPLLEGIRSRIPSLSTRRLQICLGDEGADAVAASFCSSSDKSVLIPDPYFLSSRGYANDKIEFSRLFIPLAERSGVAYWRGADTGVARHPSRLAAVRPRIALLSRENSDFLNAKITFVEPRSDYAESLAQYNSLGIIGDFESPFEMLRYRIQIDVDGNTNAWNGLFLKMLSGSAVLKVESEFGFRQWYYERMKPWRHVVPVSSSLDDLIDNIIFLQRRPGLVESLANQASEFALSLDYHQEVEASVFRLLTILE